ncbi:MAG: MFS transporter [Nannocystaceae bacterium]|nr:MFS transporter [bacterium]
MSADAPIPAPPPAAGPEDQGWGRDAGWVSSTYFGEGLPYALVNNVADAMFTLMGASLGAIGLTSLFHLPWNLKFLWGPLVDAYETKRTWLWVFEIILGALTVLLAFASSGQGALGIASVIFFLIAVAAATHDIAVDGYYLEALDEAGQSRYVGLRVAGHRVATLVGFGGFLMLAGATSWPFAWVMSAAVLFLMAFGHARFLPRAEPRQKPARQLLNARTVSVLVLLVGIVVVARTAWVAEISGSAQAAITRALPWTAKISASGWIGLALLTVLLVVFAMLPRIQRRLAHSDSDFARAYVTFLEQPGIGRALAFVITFRLGESFLLKMRTPFLLKEVQMSEGEFGLLTATIGVAATIVASIVGGWLISKHGLRRWIWPFMLSQNLLNLLYMVVAFGDPAQTSTATLGFVIIAENLGSGLGTAVFMVYIMRCAAPSHRAAHMAIVTALMSVGFTAAGVTSGFLAEAIGYANYFGFTFLATIPSMVLIPFIPHLDRVRSTTA